jgi:hypothetical protein
MGILNRNGRRRISCRLAYVRMVQDLEGEAQIIDLSFSGCRATCASPPRGHPTLCVRISSWDGLLTLD